MSDELLGHLQGAFTTPWAIGAYTLIGAVIAGRVLARVIKPVIARLTRRTAATWDDEVGDRLASPLALVLAVQLFRAVLPWIDLDPRAVVIVLTACTLVTSAGVLWGGFRSIDLGFGILAQRPWAADRPASRSLLAITARFTKVMIVLLGAIVVLAQLGVSVGSLIAGLGIGGLAIALAAQKTVENLFGTLSIGVDQPMREGDFVKLGDVLGHVETIGLRSTRVRTLDRTVVTIPNGQLANERIESYAVRDRIRFACVLGLVYGTTPAQLRAVLADLEAVLRAHPKIWPDEVTVRFQQFGASSLDVDVIAWFQTIEFSEFRGIRQDLLLAFMEVVERHGSAFAFPTRTVHLTSAALASSATPPAR